MTLSRHHKQVIPPRIRNLACLISVSWLASVGCSHAGHCRFIKDCDLLLTLKIDGEVQRDTSTFSEEGNPDFIMLLPSKGNAVLFSLSKEEQGVFAVPVEHIHRSDSTAWIDRRQILLVTNAQWTEDFLRPGKSANVEFSLNESEYEASAMRLPRARWLTADCEAAGDQSVVLLARIDDRWGSFTVNAYFPSVDYNSGLPFRVEEVLKGKFEDPIVGCAAHSGALLSFWILLGAPRDTLIEMTLTWDEEQQLYCLEEFRLVAGVDRGPDR